MTTKEQERKALEQIKKIVESLGEDSYIATAFEGCFEIAEENIENDFACSMKQRVESAEKQAAEFKRAAEYYAAEDEKKRQEVETLKKKVLTTAEAGTIKSILYHTQNEAENLAGKTAKLIVELADDPTDRGFKDAVARNRTAQKQASDCATLIQRLLETMM